MEATTSAAAGGGPAPFLLKTYDMVDDKATDEIVSWSSTNNSFVVWNPPEFARILLPTYFKHNNFSSFIRQLNTYGFRKIDPEKWEFANEDFVKDQKHLLKGIHRRKPIHSHSHPPGSAADPERAAFDEEIDRLTREKATLEANIVRSKKQQLAEKFQLEELMQKVDSMEQRQEKLLVFLEKAIQNSTFVENLARKIESLDFSAYNKKRRLPQNDHAKSIAEISFVDSHGTSRSEFGNVFHQDFSNRLRLELSPAVSDINLVSNSTQSSNEDGGSPLLKISEDPKDAHPKTSLLFAAEATYELSDTGASYTFKGDQACPRKATPNEAPGLHLLQQTLSSNDEVDGHISCHLNLTLASSPLQIKSPYSAKTPELGSEICTSPESKFNENGKESDTRIIVTDRSAGNGDTPLSSSKELPNKNQAATAPPRVNDVFWEQFLTERPGSSENEEASSSYRGNPYEEHDERRSSHGLFRNSKIVGHLSL
ncbi:heat stress transcription factor A-5 [Mercurialis annua]|uniref:heat stress transcription factor A-5 n=1 Tax=Mercurialis annua TaxID=3986 RepID=UPI00215F14A8|nr:heat stress transcription factor A-5 [Mercurialis annua]